MPIEQAIWKITDKPIRLKEEKNKIQIFVSKK